MMSVGAPVLFAVTGIAVDYVQMSSIHTSLQGVADSAAIAGAREMPLSNADNTKITAAAKAFVDYEAQKNQRVLTTTTEIKSGESITVKISEKWTPIFAHLLSSGVTPISASATSK